MTLGTTFIQILRAAVLLAIIGIGALFAMTPPPAADTGPSATPTAGGAAWGASAQIPEGAGAIPLASSTAGGIDATPLAVAASTTTPAPPVADNAQAIEAQTRAALVNILCTSRSGRVVSYLTGSGVIVDPRGVILTNAHVARQFLMEGSSVVRNVDCVIRAGSPAAPMYRATIAYLPPEWVAANAEKITAERPKGTGEYDYAFLLITSSASASKGLPDSFPFVPVTLSAPVPGSSVLFAAYPASYLSRQLITTTLYPLSAPASISKLFAFHGDGKVDLFSVRGSVLSMGGSSGGAAVRAEDGRLIGLISTATAGDTSAESELRAITMNYINRSLAAADKGGLVEFLSQDMAQAAKDFIPTARIEQRQLEAALRDD